MANNRANLEPPPPSPAPLPPMLDPAKIEAREAASWYNPADMLEHFIVPPAPSASQRPHEFWKVQNDDGSIGYWYDLDRDHTPDTYVQFQGGVEPGLYWDSNMDGIAETIFINPYDIAGPDQ